MINSGFLTPDDFQASERRWWLIGLMKRHFGAHLRDEQIMAYTIPEMEKVLAENGVNLA